MGGDSKEGEKVENEEKVEKKRVCLKHLVSPILVPSAFRVPEC